MSRYQFLSVYQLVNMAFKTILTLCALVAAVTAQYGGYGGQSGGGYGGHSSGGYGGYGHVSYREEPYDPHPQYKFEYSVHDPHTHDIKSQQEERHGDTVHGNYKLLEADGSERYVEYTADHKNGFNAVVHRQHNSHPVVHHAPVYHAPVYHAPVVKYHSAPSHSSSSYSSHY